MSFETLFKKYQELYPHIFSDENIKNYVFGTSFGYIQVMQKPEGSTNNEHEKVEFPIYFPSCTPLYIRHV